MNAAPKTVIPLQKRAQRISTTCLPAVKLHRHRRSHVSRIAAKSSSGDASENLRDQLRARLLKMILENERVRRNETRATAG